MVQYADLQWENPGSKETDVLSKSIGIIIVVVIIIGIIINTMIIVVLN